MKELKKALILAVVAASMLVAQSALAQQQTGDYNARVEAAKQYQKIVPMQKVIDDTMDQISKNPQLHMSASDIADIKSSIDIPSLQKSALDAMVKTFSLEELKMLVQFYGSPVGQSIMNKMPVYMAEVMPAVQVQLQQALVTHLKKLQQQHQQQGAAPTTTIAPASTKP